MLFTRVHEQSSNLFITNLFFNGTTKRPNTKYSIDLMDLKEFFSFDFEILSAKLIYPKTKVKTFKIETIWKIFFKKWKNILMALNLLKLHENTRKNMQFLYITA